MYWVIQSVENNTGAEPSTNWGVVSAHDTRDEAEIAVLVAAKSFAGRFFVAELISKSVNEPTLEVVRPAAK